MRHTARSHFVEVVLPAFETFVGHYTGRELGMRTDTKNAAVVAGALRDLPEHLYHDPTAAAVDIQRHGSPEVYRESFWPKDHSYRLVCDFANAWKHRNLRSPHKRMLASLDDTKEIHAIVQYRDNQGYYYASRKLVTIASHNREHDLGYLLSSSVRMWCQELLRLALIPKMPPLPALLPPHLTRADVEQLAKFRILGQKGERLEIGQKMLIYRGHENALTPAMPGEHFEAQLKVEFAIAPSIFDI